MSWPVATIDHEATLQEAAEALAADHLGVVLVLRVAEPVGILSERDVVAHTGAGSDLSHLRAGETIADDLVTVQADSSILDAARAMADAACATCPFWQGRLVAGMVSVRDLLPVLADAARRRRRRGAQRHPADRPQQLTHSRNPHELHAT